MHHPTDRIAHTTAFVTPVGALTGTKNSSMGPPWRIDPTTYRTMSERSYHGATFRSPTPIEHIHEIIISCWVLNILVILWFVVMEQTRHMFLQTAIGRFQICKTHKYRSSWGVVTLSRPFLGLLLSALSGLSACNFASSWLQLHGHNQKFLP